MRANIILYIDSNKLYFAYKNKQIARSSKCFYKFGEIYNESKFIECLNSIFSKISSFDLLLKPNFNILYNDTSDTDIKFLYKEALKNFGYNEINFYKITELFKNEDNFSKIVICDNDYYIIPSKMVKTKKLDINNPVLIGCTDENNMHYQDKNLVWNTFKSRFTKD